MFCRTDIKSNQRKMRNTLALILLTLFLISCSSKKDRMPEDGEIKINLIADKDINPNEKGHPAPLNIFIYNIRDTDVFSNADFFEIIEGSNKSLASTSSKMYEAILKPGEMRSIFLSTENKVQALGVIGAYRDLNDAVWLKIYELPPPVSSWWKRMFSDDAIALNVNFKKSAITIRKMD